MGLEMLVMLEEREQLKQAFVGELEAAEAALVQKEVLPTVWISSVLVPDDDDDANLGPRTVEGRRSSHATADFEAGFKIGSVAQRRRSLTWRGKRIMTRITRETQSSWGMVVCSVSFAKLYSPWRKRMMRRKLRVRGSKRLVLRVCLRWV